MNNFKDYAGNRANLRSKAINQIKRVTAISEHLGALGEFLVTTWGSVLMSLGILGIWAIIVFAIVKSAGLEIIGQNIIPTIFLIVGIIILTLNILLINPVQGSQLLVSSKFVFKKVKEFGKVKGRQKEKWWRFWDNGKQDIIETVVGKHHYYLLAYNVRGIVSPTTFESDLEIAATADEELLLNSDRKIVITTIVSIDKTSVKKRSLPNNATAAMQKKRNLQYNLTVNNNHQQIKTSILLTAQNINLLKQGNSHLQAAFSKGLVIGYKRLKGQDMKNVFQEVFGEGKL